MWLQKSESYEYQKQKAIMSINPQTDIEDMKEFAKTISKEIYIEIEI